MLEVVNEQQGTAPILQPILKTLKYNLLVK